MSQWQTADAKQRFGELIEATAGGPQLVMRHEDPVAVILSVEDFRRLKRQADANFAALLSASPIGRAEAEPVGMSLADSA